MGIFDKLIPVEGWIASPEAAVIGVTLFVVIAIAALILKGLAMYKAAKLKEKGFFWSLLIFNTMGILPAIYLYLRRKRKV